MAQRAFLAANVTSLIGFVSVAFCGSGLPDGSSFSAVANTLRYVPG